MNRIVIPKARDCAVRHFSSRLLRCVLAGAGSLAAFAPAIAQLAAPVYVSGTAQATITVNFVVPPAASSTISCTLSLSSNDARGPADSQTVTAVVNGATGVCNITMYYRWRLTVPTQDSMTISYSVTGPVQTSSGVVNIIPMPHDGTTTGPMNIIVTQ